MQTAFEIYRRFCKHESVFVFSFLDSNTVANPLVQRSRWQCFSGPHTKTEDSDSPLIYTISEAWRLFLLSEVYSEGVEQWWHCLQWYLSKASNICIFLCQPEEGVAYTRFFFVVVWGGGSCTLQNPTLSAWPVNSASDSSSFSATSLNSLQLVSARDVFLYFPLLPLLLFAPTHDAELNWFFTPKYNSSGSLF